MNNLPFGPRGGSSPCACPNAAGGSGGGVCIDSVLNHTPTPGVRGDGSATPCPPEYLPQRTDVDPFASSCKEPAVFNPPI